MAGVALPATLIVLLLGAVLFAPVLFGGKVMSPSDWVMFSPPFAAERPSDLVKPSNFALNDETVLFENHLARARAAIRDGRLPLWSAAVGAGRPLGAEQGAPLYPTSWLAYVLPFWHALGWMALAKLLLAGLGMALFCASIGLRRAPCLLAGIAYPFSTLFFTFLGHGETANFALAPWSLLAAERLVVSRRIGPAIGLGLVLGLALYGGHPETFLLLALFTYAYLAFRLAGERRSRGAAGIPRLAGLGIGAAVVGSLIGAFYLAGFDGVVAHGTRLSRLSSAHISLRDTFVGLTLPEIWGRPDKVVLHAATGRVSSAFFNGRDYVGIVPVLLAAIGLLRRPDPRQWFFLIAGAISLLIALGGAIDSLVRHIPVLSLLSAFQYVWPVSVALVVLAASGFQRLIEADPILRRRALILIGAVALAGVAFAIGLRPHLISAAGRGLGDLPTLRPSESNADAAAAGSLERLLLLSAIAAALVWATGRPGARRWVAVALIVVSAADLVAIDHGWWPAVPQRYVAPPATTTLRTVARSGPRWRLAGFASAFTPDLAERYGVLDARDLDLPELARYTRLFASLGGFVAPQFGQTAILRITPSQQKLLDLFAVRWYMDYGGAEPVPAGWRVVSWRPGDRLLENPSALPRAWVAYGGRPADGLNGALAAVASASARGLEQRPVIEGLRAPMGLSAPPTAARFVSSTDTRVQLSVVARKPGWLVLEDTYFPGWTATVDGRPTRIYAANAAFRAVRVPAGTDRVVFDYDPVALRVTFWLSVASLVLAVAALAALGARGRRQRRR